MAPPQEFERGVARAIARRSAWLGDEFASFAPPGKAAHPADPADPDSPPPPLPPPAWRTPWAAAADWLRRAAAENDRQARNARVRANAAGTAAFAHAIPPRTQRLSGWLGGGGGGRQKESSRRFMRTVSSDGDWCCRRARLTATPPQPPHPPSSSLPPLLTT
jgi:hypothetical protein